MKGLLIKDFRQIKMQKNFFLIIAMISIGFIVSSGGNTGYLSYAIGFSCFASSLFSLSTVSYDEFDNGNPFLFSLPITRKNYVLEKYCFGVMTGFGCWLLFSGLAAFFVLYNGLALTGERIVSALILIPFFLLLLAILLPLTLKFGSEKSRFAVIGVFGIIFLLGYLGNHVVKTFGIDLSPVVRPLASLSAEALIGGLTVLSLLLLLLSLNISISIVKKKEF